MKQIRSSLLLLFALAGVSLTNAQTSDNFNSRSAANLDQLKSYLQSRCWEFNAFDINGFHTNIEGDGVLTSSSGAAQCLLYTPVLKMNGNVTVSFNYRFSAGIGNSRRWMKIMLTSGNNNITQKLDSVEFDGVRPGTTYHYSKTFAGGAGPLKLLLMYEGSQNGPRIAIDELEISSALHYNNSCNSAPVAVNDVVAGGANRAAMGNVSNNDSDPDGESFSAYVISNSANGNVAMNPNGTFTFTPSTGFNGTQTTFTYQVCDQGFGSLCSEQATVTINFPAAGILPVSMVDFHGQYNGNGAVQLSWITNFENNTDRFEVERSFDGLTWQKTGALKAQGWSSVKTPYSYVDNVGRNNANKKDLYYRLKQIDLNGRAGYTRILIVRVYNTKSLKMVSVTPNPAKNDISVNVQLNETSVIVMKLLTNSGAEVMKKTVKANSGSNSYLMEGSNRIQKGMYLLEVIINSKERMIVKLIKE